MSWELIPPLLIFAVCFYALVRRTDVFGAFISGAREGLQVIFRIVPSLVLLLGVMTMLRVSGFMEVFSDFCAPFFSLLGLPPECAPILVVRPFSGSGALAVGIDIMRTYGADSLIGRTAAVMLGSTETTFYAVSVICGASGVRRTRYIIPAALCADLAGYLGAALSVRLFFPS